MTESPLAVARTCLEAYVAKDRAAIEALIDKDYHFTSPIDNALDRETHFARCWPNSKAMTGFDYIYQVADGDRAFIVPEGHTANGKTFRNCEVHAPPAMVSLLLLSVRKVAAIGPVRGR